MASWPWSSCSSPRRRCRGSVEIKLARSVSVLVAGGCGTRGRPHLPFHGYVLHDRKLPRGRGGGDLLLDALVNLSTEFLSIYEHPTLRTVTGCPHTLCRAAVFTAAAFFGATYRFPFFVEAAALAECLEEFPFLFCNPFGAPWTIMKAKDRLQMRDRCNSGESRMGDKIGRL